MAVMVAQRCECTNATELKHLKMVTMADVLCYVYFAKTFC